MWLRADVGGLRVGNVHGDASSLAGWGFAQGHLRDASHRGTVRGWFGQAGVDGFACAHTCLPVFQALHSGGAPSTPGSAAGCSPSLPHLRPAPQTTDGSSRNCAPRCPTFT